MPATSAMPSDDMTHQDSLVAVMIAVSASDRQMPTSELLTIQQIVDYLPVFAGYDADRIATVSRIVLDLFDQEEGLDAFFALVRTNLPPRLFETAYALACDVAATDGAARQTELRLLQEIRDELGIDRLHAAAIEWGARLRHLKG